MFKTRSIRLFIVFEVNVLLKKFLSEPNIYYPWSYQKRIACVEYSLQCPRTKFLGQSLKVITNFFEFKFVTVTPRYLTYLALNILDCKGCTCTQTFKVYGKVIDLLSSRNRKVKFIFELSLRKCMKYWF